MENIRVRDLKKIIKNMDDDALIVISIDPEGNAYRPIVDHSPQYSYDENSQEIGLTSIDESMKLAGYTEDEVMEGGEPCLLLWPR